MENTTQPKANSKIITDPEKLKKNIRYGGLFGIILGAISILLGFVGYMVIEPSIGTIIEAIVVGVLFIIFGLLIRKNPPKAKKPTYAALGLCAIIILLNVLVGRMPGWLLIIYAIELIHSLKYIKRLEGQQSINQ